jgi:hypothetical protein
MKTGDDSKQVIMRTPDRTDASFLPLMALQMPSYLGNFRDAEKNGTIQSGGKPCSEPSFC